MSQLSASVTEFGHPPAVLAFWRRLAREALARVPTPFYLCSLEPIRAALAQIESLDFGLPVTHWLSCKTQPVRPLLQWWRRQRRPIEVVSEFEFRAAVAEGFPPERILVNGPAKHRWLPAVARPALLVNFDSPAELAALLPLAKRLRWRVGIRLHTREEFDPDRPSEPTQFGFEAGEAVVALRQLQRAGVSLETIHFHLRTNVASAAIYERALAEVAEICRIARFSPRHLDAGGGWPPPYTLAPDGRRFDAGFDLQKLAAMFRRVPPQFAGTRELWLENGRFLTARSGVLAARVLDVKERGGRRQLIANGGRTLHALVSNWEQHALLFLPERRGPHVPTTVFGPTCMAFDQLARGDFPAGIRAGDHFLWLDAGAYHLPWETQFSHGRAAVLWHDGARLRIARRAERFEEGWRRWR